MSSFASNLLGSNKQSSNTDQIVTCVGNSCPGCTASSCLSSSRTYQAAPIMGPTTVLNTQVREQHVMQQQAPAIQERHVIQEKHILRETPVLEKTVIHEQPIVEQRTVIHEKPVIHERTVVHRQQEVIREAPMYQQVGVERVTERPLVVREAITMNSSAPIMQQPIMQQPIVHQQPIMQQPIITQQQPLMAAQPLMGEPTLLHETVSGSAVYDKSKHTNANSASLREDALRHQTDMNQALAGENDRIAANLKAAAAERQILAGLDAKAPASTAKSTRSA